MENYSEPRGNDNGVYGYALPGETELTITKMEHYWDELGYLQGLDNQFVPGLAEVETELT